MQFVCRKNHQFEMTAEQVAEQVAPKSRKILECPLCGTEANLADVARRQRFWFSALWGAVWGAMLAMLVAACYFERNFLIGPFAAPIGALIGSIASIVNRH